MAYCTCTVLFFVCILLFVDNLFFYSSGQLVSCKASLAALWLYGFLWYGYDDVLSETKYDDDDDNDSLTFGKIEL